MRKVFVVLVVCLLAYNICFSENLKPQPVFKVTAKVLEYNVMSNKMTLEIFNVGELVRPGLYGSYMRDKYKAGDKVAVVCEVDKNLKIETGNIVEGSLERLGEAKTSNYNFFNIKVVAANQKLYNLKSRFDKDTAVFKKELYGTDN